jgi:hypothetical protein
MKHYKEKKSNKIGMKTGKRRNLPTPVNFWDIFSLRIDNPHPSLINKKSRG